MLTRISRSTVLLAALGLMAAALLASPASAAKAAPTLVVSPADGSVSISSDTFAANSAVNVSGCGYRDTRTEILMHPESTTYSYWWDVAVDANGCISTNTTLGGAGKYLFMAEQAKGSNWDVVAQTEVTAQ